MSSSSDEPSTSTTPPTKKKKLNINQTILVSEESSSIVQLYVKLEDGTFEPVEQCSPIKKASTRFKWESHVEVDDDDENWTPPTPNTRAKWVFDAVKTHLKWIGADKDMKSSPEMKKLLQSGKTLMVNLPGKKEDEQQKMQVTFKDGRISYGTGVICKDDYCWKVRSLENFCDEHGNWNKTHFLIRDTSNVTPTFALLSTRGSHSPKTIITLKEILKSTKGANQFYAFSKYEEQQGRTNDDGQSLPSPWVLVTPRPLPVHGSQLVRNSRPNSKKVSE
ncbi:uncharacterized protein LOC118434981 [Folsomia candida]|uniref:uncharacterized protein LOC118434981 n=1 Tax=Folsomia candida TaxID=158441 RepID=UPI001604D9F5|nr:uncharacterized protein LOC118434981 [Folsomia candida]